jgi:hypothetical protein
LNGLTNNQKYFFTFFSGHQSAIIDSNNNLTREMLVKQDAGSLGGVVFVGLTFVGISQLFALNWGSRFFNPVNNSISEVFIMDSLPFSGIYDYVRKVANLWADPSLILKYDVTVDVEDFKTEIPVAYALYQNYPNPFNPITTIRYTIPVVERFSESFNNNSERISNSLYKVTLMVYDILGNEIATLVNEEKPAGSYEVEFTGEGLPSGVYFYQIKTGSFVETKKMVFMK